MEYNMSEFELCISYVRGGNDCDYVKTTVKK